MVIPNNLKFQVYHTDDFELQLLQKGFCPFCRAPGYLTRAEQQDNDEDME